jgi:hypothetical protein
LHSHLEQSVMSQLADQGADVIDNGVGDQVGGQGVCGMGQTDEVFHLGEVESFGGGAAGGVHGLVLSGSPGRRWVWWAGKGPAVRTAGQRGMDRCGKGSRSATRSPQGNA